MWLALVTRDDLQPIGGQPAEKGHEAWIATVEGFFETAARFFMRRAPHQAGQRAAGMLHLS